MHPFHSLGRLRSAALFSILAATAVAQRPSLWTTTTLPAGASTPNAIGTTVVFTAPGAVHLYSGITRQWTVLPVVSTPTVFQANDYCIVRDGNMIHGFAAHTGKVDTLTTNGGATVVSGPASSSWVTLVSEGTTAWAFGAFHGQWTTQVLQQAAPTMVANRLLGLLRDGSTVYGVSAHHGTFVPVAADPAATLSLVGEAEVGTANSPGILRAFSAQQNTWGTQVVPGVTGSLQQNEFAMMWAGNQIWAFSGLSGALVTYTANNPIAAVTAAEGVAWFADGGNVVCYGAGRGQFAAIAANNPAITLDYHFALLVEPNQVTPFSGVLGAFGAPLPGNYFVGTNDEVGYAGDGTQVFGYSPIRNTWAPAPMQAPLSVTVVRSAVVLGDTTGYCAMSARTGTWVSQPTSIWGTYQGPASGATFVAIDGNNDIVHVFDARLGRWATATGQAPFTIRISRHTVVVHDGFTAYGFGQPSSEWYGETLTTNPSRFDVASSVGLAIHGTNQLSVYSVQGPLSYTGRYPEFTQAVNLGNPIRMHQTGTPGSFLFFLIAFGSGYLDVRPAVDGVVYLDQASAVSLFWPQPIDADGILDMVFVVPNNPAFVGLQLHMQNLVLEPAGQPWLSTSVAPIVF